MRIRSLIAFAALMLVPATLSAQQTTQAAQTPPADANTKSFNIGYIDFGVRGTTSDGDAARYERYRDMSDGLFLDELRHNQRNDAGWRFKLGADNLGRKDQKYMLSATKQGKARTWFVWDEIPMLFSRTTQTLFQGDVLNNRGQLTIDDAIQAAGQASAANIPLLFPSNAQTFELSTRREILEFGGQVAPVRDLNLKAMFRHTDREGGIPFGGAFGHSQVVETIAPVSHQTQEFDAGAEWARDRYLFRAGYTGSWFKNDVETLAFDNPWRVTDLSTASSRGRLSLPPSNSFVGVNGLASIKLPGHSRLNAYISTSMLQDSDASSLMPNTINTATIGLLPLPRTTVQGEATTLAYNVNFTSRPSTHFDFAARFQGYEYDNKTSEFDMVQRIAYDNAPSAVNPPIPTEAFGVNRDIMDLEARWIPTSGTSLGVGFNRYGEARNHRIFEEAVENVTRITFDTLGNRWFSVRARYEHGERRGEGFDEEVLTSVSEQPSMRHFDLASRDRDRFTLIGMVTPINNVVVNLSVAAGNDNYLESGMGLGDNNHRVYAIGFDATPRDKVAFGMSYSNENYTSLARSRQASPNSPAGCVNTYPPPAGQTTCQFYDPTRNWQSDVDDNAHSFILNASFLQLWDKVDINVAWDINRSKAFYGYVTDPTNDPTLPEGTPPLTSSLPPPTQLPDVISNLNRGEVDLMYNFNRRFGLGLSYWYEDYEVQDWALDAESTGNIARSNAVLLGYMYKPYTAQTVWLRLVARW